MKKLSLLLLGIAAVMTTACQQDEELQKPTFTITATMPQSTGTRVTYEPIGEGAVPGSIKVKWTAGDKISYTDNSNSVYSNPLEADNIFLDGTSATFTFDTEPTDGTEIHYGTIGTGQTQADDNSLEHLKDHHMMSGTYNTTTKNIAFEHNVSVMRIALLGLKKSAPLDQFTLSRGINSYSLDLSGCSTTDSGEFIAWLNIDPKDLDGVDQLDFTLVYVSNSETVSYTHSFGSGINPPDIKGQLLYCTINMESKVGFTTIEFSSDPTWKDPVYTAPKGYDYAVYDAATFAAMPAESGKKIIQIADIRLTDEQISRFESTYNGNGYTITKETSGAVFDYSGSAIIVHTHVRGGAMLINKLNGCVSQCSVEGNMMADARAYDNGVASFTLCSTDQEKLVNDDTGCTIVACWYDNQAQGLTEGGEGAVWNSMDGTLRAKVSINYLIDEHGRIIWDYVPY